MKSHRRHPLLVCLTALLETACARSEHLPVVRDGDLIFQTSRSSQSVAIQRATGSPYSHMGLVLVRDGKPYVFEAVATVRFTPLDRWIARGAGGHFVVKRLRNAGSVLDAAGINRLRTAALRFAGRPYDPTFEWSDDRIYCSELVWKGMTAAVSTSAPFKPPATSIAPTPRCGPRCTNATATRCLPLNESVISPVTLFQSTLLTTVAQR